MQGLLSQAAALRKLTLRGAVHDRLSARLGLERALNGVDWALPGLPPRAVLLVRHLVLAPRETAGPLRFAQQVSQALRVHADKARRPWLQADAATAEAVLFADEAELAACLVSDALRGAVGAHWWWPAVLAGRSVKDWLRTQLLARGELLPPVLGLLSARARAVPWAESWTAADAGQGAAALAHAHGVELQADVAVVAVGKASPSRGLIDDDDAPAADASASSELRGRVPELSQPCRLSAPSARLLAAALLLQRDPAWLHAPAGAAALAAWHAWLPGEPNAERRPVVAPTEPQRAGTALLAEPWAPVGPASSEHARLLQAPAPALWATAFPQPAQLAAGAIQRERDEAAALKSTQAGDAPVVPPPGRAAPLVRVGEPAHADFSGRQPSPVAGVGPFQHAAPIASHASARDGGAAPTALPALELPTSARPQLGRVVHTGYGGLFYLLNVALALGLYGDFTMPRMRGLALSPWDLLAMVGRAWFGAGFTRDPVWPLLAELAGHRVSQAPGRGFVPPAVDGVVGDWRVDPAWLVPWGEGAPLRRRGTAQRVQGVHAAGFVVFDLARAGAASPPRAAAARWLRLLLRYLSARLALALGSADAAGAPALMCRLAAEVHVSATTLDLQFSLDQLPLAVRVAGLDRDPGWIPAAGRSLCFHFR